MKTQQSQVRRVRRSVSIQDEYWQGLCRFARREGISNGHAFEKLTRTRLKVKAVPGACGKRGPKPTREGK